MRTRPFGSTGVLLPIVGFGTWRVFDVDTADTGPAAVVSTALDGGARVFDSSPMYGQAEAVLSTALGPRRDEAFIATKVWTEDPADGQRHFERQLAWFGGRVDLLQVHNLLAWRDHVPWMERARERGEIGYLGVTHYSAAAFPELEQAMLSGRFQSIQVPFNPSQPEAARRILPLAAERGIGVLAMRPFGEGTLIRRPVPPEARAKGIDSAAEALLRWCLSDPRITCALPATRSPDHAAHNVAMGDKPDLDPETRVAIATAWADGD